MNAQHTTVETTQDEEEDNTRTDEYQIVLLAQCKASVPIMVHTLTQTPCPDYIILYHIKVGLHSFTFSSILNTERSIRQRHSVIGRNHDFSLPVSRELSMIKWCYHYVAQHRTTENTYDKL